jgi:hypothetical protein
MKCAALWQALLRMHESRAGKTVRRDGWYLPLFQAVGARDKGAQAAAKRASKNQAGNGLDFH